MNWSLLCLNLPFQSHIRSSRCCVIQSQVGMEEILSQNLAVNPYLSNNSSSTINTSNRSCSNLSLSFTCTVQSSQPTGLDYSSRLHSCRSFKHVCWINLWPINVSHIKYSPKWLKVLRECFQIPRSRFYSKVKLFTWRYRWRAGPRSAAALIAQALIKRPVSVYGVNILCSSF